MYNIGVRVDHGTFHGIKMATNHNFVCERQLNLGLKIPLNEWGVVGTVYQSSHRRKPLNSQDIVLVVEG
jgi:hypothetical protein